MGKEAPPMTVKDVTLKDLRNRREELREIEFLQNG